MRFRWLIAGIACGFSIIPRAQELGPPPKAPTPLEVAQMKLREPLKAQFGSGFSVNVQSREEVRNFYKSVYAASTQTDMKWNGDSTNCIQGTTDSLFKEQVRLRLNFFRAMAGVPSTISFNDTFSAKDQLAALMMGANNALNHFPPTSWKCYTADGAEAAGKSNLALGYNGPASVNAYVEDFGSNNAIVGHRRWILYPQTKFMGTGDTPFESGRSVNALWVVDGNFGTTRPSTRDGFVAWPPPGYVPYQLVPARWSISFPNATFSAAAVTMSSNGVSMAVTKESVVNGYGENTLVWYPTGYSPVSNLEWPKPTSDITYAVGVTGVSGSGVPTSFNYQVKVFDPATPGPDTVLPTISGPDSITVLNPQPFTFAKLPLATGYELRVRERVPAALEGAENGLGNFLVNTSGSYAVVIESPVAGGTKAFRFTHHLNRAQSLTYLPTLLIRPGAKLNFASRMGIAYANEIAKVQLSTNDFISYTDIFTQAGNGSTVVDANYVNRSIALDSFADQIMKLRVTFESGFGSFYSTFAANYGFYFDEISFENVDELKNLTVSTVSTNGTFTFTATAAGGYALDLRPELYEEFSLDWGPVKAVTATLDVLPRIEFQPAFVLGETTVKFEFNLSNIDAGATLQLYKAPSVDGPWSIESGAVFETISLNSRRVTIPRGSAPTAVYKVKAQ